MTAELLDSKEFLSNPDGPWFGGRWVIDSLGTNDSKFCWPQDVMVLVFSLTNEKQEPQQQQHFQ
jgi:hypothetical protein